MSGIFAQHLVKIRDSLGQAFTKLCLGLPVEFLARELECTLVERLTNLLWREKRLVEAEAEKFTMRNQSADEISFVPSSRNLSLKDQHLIGRCQGMLERQMRETLQDFHREKERRLQLIEEDDTPKS